MKSFAVNEEDEDTLPEEESQEKQRLNLTVNVGRPSACQRHVTVEVSRDDIERYFDEELSRMVPSAAVPGFRPGRAPRKLVESHFRKDLREKIKSTILYDSLTQITEDEKFATISEPEFDIESVKLPDDGPLTFEFDIEVRPDFELPKWKGLSLERPVREVTDADVERRLAEMLETYSDFVPTGEPIQAGDSVTARFEFFLGDERIASTDSETFELLPNVSFHDGTITNADKLLRGANIGETLTTIMEIGNDCQREDLRGCTVQVQIHVEEINRPTKVDATPDILLSFGKFESEAELKDAIRSSLQRQQVYHQNQRIRQQISNSLTEASNWELPPNLLQRQSERELNRAMMELKSSGFSEAEIRSHLNLLRQNSKASTATALREHFILERIAEEEGVDASDEDFDAEILQMALQSNESPRSIRARIEKRGLIDILRNQIVERKVIDLIKSNAKFKDVPYTPPATTTAAIEFAVGGVQHEEIPVAKHADEPQTLSQPAQRT